MNEISLKQSWRLVRISECCDQISNRVDNPSESGYARFVGLEHMQTREVSIREWDSTEEVTSAMKLFKAGDVLVARRNVYLERAARADFDGVCSGDAIVLRSKNSPCLPDLLPFILNTDQFWAYANSEADGSMSKRLSVARQMDYEFALPPLEEQRRIVKILSSVDILTDSINNALASAYTLQLSVLTTEFDPDKYSPIRLAKLCGDGTGIQIGPFGAQLHKAEYVEHGIPVIMPTNMNFGKIDVSEIAHITEHKAEELGIHRVKSGDILLPRRGELNRRAFVEKHNEGWLCGTGSLRIRVDKKVSSEAVFFALSSPQVVRWLKGNAVGTTMPNLNSKIVERIPITLPPEPRLVLVVEYLEILNQKIIDLIKRLRMAKEMKAKLLLKTLGNS